MKYCVSCGNPVDDSAKFCTVCGAEIKPTDEAPKGFTAENTGGEARESKVDEAINRLTNTADTTSDYAVDDINNNRLMSILAYIGILVLVPLFAAKESPFARFHTNQGLLLLILHLIGWVLSFIPYIGWVACGIINVVCFVLFILGLINAVRGDAKELPLIGKYRILK